MKVDLWRHVVESAQISIQVSFVVSTCDRSGKSEVSNFYGFVLVQQNVLCLQISVSEPLLMYVIKPYQYLLEEISCLIFSKSATHSNDVINFTPSGKLQHNIVDLL